VHISSLDETLATKKGLASCSSASPMLQMTACVGFPLRIQYLVELSQNTDPNEAVEAVELLAALNFEVISNDEDWVVLGQCSGRLSFSASAPQDDILDVSREKEKEGRVVMQTNSSRCALIVLSLIPLRRGDLSTPLLGVQKTRFEESTNVCVKLDTSAENSPIVSCPSDNEKLNESNNKINCQYSGLTSICVLDADSFKMSEHRKGLQCDIRNTKVEVEGENEEASKFREGLPLWQQPPKDTGTFSSHSTILIPVKQSTGVINGSAFAGDDDNNTAGDHSPHFL